ncbi:MAG: hypothetical protein Kow0042_21630 [Calditrichia bacterium]
MQEINLFCDLLNGILMGGIIFLIPAIGYAEIHYRLGRLPSLLFKREPEIVFDLPRRTQSGNSVPLFLIVKDAHLFPVKLCEMQIQIRNLSHSAAVQQNLQFNFSVSEKFFNRIIELESTHFPEPGNYQILVKLFYRNRRNKPRVLIQDNYSQIPHPPFELAVQEENLPRREGWYWGDLHVHSQFTEDQVEFGAPIAHIARATHAMGLHFAAVTDHSYDLDDLPDNYLVSDPRRKKWSAFLEEVRRVQQEYNDLIIIPGEEVSVGNLNNRNVHCLILNDPNFHEGSGDSGEKFFGNHPTQSLKQLLHNKSADSVALAAHPAEKPPLSQRIVLRRGLWSRDDCLNHGMNALQILNGRKQEVLRAGLELWKNLLLEGKHIGLAAGNDSHGNFNCFRQLRMPFLRMIYKQDHLFGEMRMAIRTDSFSLSGLMEGIRQHRSIISNGPFAALYIHSPDFPLKQIGDRVMAPSGSRIRIEAISTSEFGSWKKLVLYFGQKKQRQESCRELKIPSEKFRLEIDTPLENSGVDYVRLEAFTEKESMPYFCMTNPIWFVKKDDRNES